MASAPQSHRPRSSGDREQAERDRQRELGKRRGSAASRGYGYKWRKAADAWLIEHPWCVNRKEHTNLVAAYCVDHIVPRRLAPSLFWDRNNWQGLCRHCHERIKKPLEISYERGEIGADALDLRSPDDGGGVKSL